MTRMTRTSSTRRRAYRAGFHAGTIADVGGTPLTAYRYPGLVKAYHDGFTDAQSLKSMGLETPNPAAVAVITDIGQ